MRTEMFKLRDEEETAGLLAETCNCTLLDSRAAEVALDSWPEADRNPDRSDSENAIRLWRELLPGKDTEWLDVRIKYGWTREEIRTIANLVGKVSSAHTAASESQPHAAWKESLRREAEHARVIYDRWLDMVDEANL